MPTLTVDGEEVTVDPGTTVLQACEAAGAEIPRFCYHERLSIAGNCRMCLVEMEKAPKPIASCAMPAGDGMVIKTTTETVKKAREGVMEFLLINHPLDCPICDQGGECDLQDQAMAYGRGHSRYDEHKRAVKEKNMGPLVKTIMTRCIHCTRCVRFAEEVAGSEDIGALWRGENTQIQTYLEQTIASEMSGNVVDLCPVGALTSKPYAFTARPWELKKTESIDVMDAMGASIRIDSRSREVLRVLPRLNEEINEEWISDKTRHVVDGLKKRRLDKCFVKKDDKLQPATWGDAFVAIASKLDGLDGSKVAAIAGDQTDAETMLVMKELMEKLGSANIDCRQDGAKIGNGARAGYLFNSGIAGIEDADTILIVGANPKWEATVLNSRIRKRFLKGKVKIGVIGEQHDLKYKYDYLGAGPATLKDLADGNGDFAAAMKAADKPMIILGPGAVAREDGAAVLATAKKLADATGVVNGDWNGFNVMAAAASRVGGLDLGFVPGDGGKDTGAILDGAASGDVELVWLLGADEIDMAKLDKAFVVYQGSHGDAGAHAADVILPGVAYTEKSATYVNMEGRVQQTARAIFAPGDAREDWTILRAFSDVVKQSLPYNNAGQVMARMIEIAPHFAELEDLVEAEWGDFGTDGTLSDAPFESPIRDFYLTNAMARASEVLNTCSEEAAARNEEKATGTNG